MNWDNLVKGGVKDTPENRALYSLLEATGKDITFEQMSRPYVEVYREVFPKPNTIGSEEGYLQRDKPLPKQAISPVKGQGVRQVAVKDIETPKDTSGKPSATGSMVKKGLDAYQWLMEQPAKLGDNPVTRAAKKLPGARELERQSLLPPEERRGVSGAIASTLPRRYTTKATEAIENPLMSMLRLLNIPSTMIGVAGETLAEQVGLGTIPDDLKGKSFGERAVANYSRQASKLEGVTELGEKVGRTAQAATGAKPDAGVLPPGARQATKALGLDEKKLNPIGLDDVGWLVGLGVDVLVPSPAELVSFTKGLKPVKATKPVVSTIETLPGNVSVFDNVEWSKARTASNGKPTDILEDNVSTGKTLIVGMSDDITEEMFKHADTVVKADTLPYQGNNVLGIEYKLDKGELKQTRLLSRIENQNEIDELVSTYLRESDPRGPVARAEADIDLAKIEDPTLVRQPTAIVDTAKYNIARKQQAAMSNAMDELVDVSGRGKPLVDTGNALSPRKTERNVLLKHQQQYENELASIPERWKFWARRGKLDEGFYETMGRFATKENNKVVINPDHLIDNFIESVIQDTEKVGFKINDKETAILDDTIRTSIRQAARNALRTADVDKLLQSPTASMGRVYDVIMRILQDPRGLRVAVRDADGKLIRNVNARFSFKKEPPAFDKILAKTYWRTSADAISGELVQKLEALGFNALDRLGKHAPTADAFSSRGYKVENIIDVAKRTLSKDKPNFGYDELIKELMDITGKSYDQVFNDLVEIYPLQDIIASLSRDVNELVIWTRLDASLKDKTFVDTLASQLASHPEFKELFPKLPSMVLKRRAQTLIERMSLTDKRDLTPVIRFLADFLSRHATFLKSGILSGFDIPVPFTGWSIPIPNFRYMTMNFLSNPLVVYQQLGLRSTLGMAVNIPDATRVVAHVFNKGDIKGAAPVIAGKYTVDDLARIVTEHNLMGGSARFELTGEVLEDMRNYLPRDKADYLQRLGEGIGIKATPNRNAQFASAVDTVYRTGVLIDALRNGDSEAIAIRKAQEALFDYYNLSDIERGWVAHNFFFYSFMRHNFVSTLKNLMTGKGQTRIKNQLKLVYEPLEDNEATSEWTDTRIPFKGLSTPDDYKMYGPSIPTAEALKQMAQAMSMVYFLSQGQANTASEYPLDFMAQQGINPYGEATFDWLFDGEFDARRRRRAPDSPDERIVQVWKSLGFLEEDGSGPAAELFQLVPDTKERYSGTVLDPKKRNNYKFANDEGKKNYALWQSVLVDTMLGTGRTSRDYARLQDPKTEGETLSRAMDFLGGGTLARDRTQTKAQADAYQWLLNRYKEK